ncbi:cathepsin G-like [Moschus berezovskii]|uniref:cathepsin G-like n=1 Tax=Moschus berezovskii TaxID=68408 RepID=UPI002444D500|nr:cathepsin G-like [Moschus berezovskii]
MLVRTVLNWVGLGFRDTVPISAAGTDSAAVRAIALKASVTAFPQGLKVWQEEVGAATAGQPRREDAATPAPDGVSPVPQGSGSQINVILGIHSVTASEWTQQRIPVLRPIPHPRYNQWNNRNDIMLLQLAYRVRQNEAVRLVALPQTEEMLSPGTQCTVAGWGLTELNRRAITLQEVQLTIQRDGECHSHFDFYTGQKQICVGDPREGKSTFLGDSGGPLVCNNVAQGIVSYGDRMGTPPAVFTRISSFLPWIRRTMRLFKEWRPDVETSHKTDSPSLGQSPAPEQIPEP